MDYRRVLAKRGYLIFAMGAVLLATIVLGVMQFLSSRRAEMQKRATLEANLELRLLDLVNETKHAMMERADHITHSISHDSVRKRKIKKLARRYTRALDHYPEMRDMYAVFFERGDEEGAWRALRFMRPNPNDPNTTYHKGVPVGYFVEDEATTQTLRQAFLAISNRNDDATYANFAPVSLNDSTPRQIFFHPVYEPDHVEKRGSLDRIGLLVFTAEPEHFPYQGYYQHLIAHQQQRAFNDEAVGQLVYQISVSAPNTEPRSLVKIGESSEPLRQRGFETNDRIFPHLRFGVALRDRSAAAYALGQNGLSLLISLAAMSLALIGLGLTWRATTREIRLARLKSDFLSNISHELKTPLTAIRALGDLLRTSRARNSERVREYGQIITLESDRLTLLLNNILEMSRLERGARRYRFVKGDVGPIAADVVEVLLATPRAQGFVINVQISSEPVWAEFDEGALRQILLNLLSNAVKYSGGSRSVNVAVKAENDAAVIEVRDYGIGVAPDEQKRIFDAFHRASQEEVQAKSGSGLGLSIAREIAHAHGGEVSVESQLNEGAIFRLSLPLLQQETQDPDQAGKETIFDGSEDSDHRRRTERVSGIAR